MGSEVLNKIYHPDANGDNIHEYGGTVKFKTAMVWKIGDILVNMTGLANKLNNLESGDVVDEITAHAGGGQADATELTGEYNNVTTVASNYDSVKLPTAVKGLKIKIKNSGANILSVFPNTADSINAMAINLSIDVPVGCEIVLNAISATVWKTNETAYFSAPSTQSGGIQLSPVDNSGNYIVKIKNEAHGQSTDSIIPDTGLATDYFVKTTAKMTVAKSDLLQLVNDYVHSVENVVSLAEANAGKIIKAGLTGKSYKPVGLFVSVSGNWATGTSVDLVDETTGTIVASLAQAQLTDGAILLENDTGVTLGAGWLASLGSGEGLKVVKVGSDFTGGTSITIRALYKVA